MEAADGETGEEVAMGRRGEGEEEAARRLRFRLSAEVLELFAAQADQETGFEVVSLNQNQHSEDRMRLLQIFSS